MSDADKIEAATIAVGRMISGYDRPIDRRDYRPIAVAILNMLGLLDGEPLCGAGEGGPTQPESASGRQSPSAAGR